MLAEIVAREAKAPEVGGDGSARSADPLSGEMENLVSHLTKQMRINESNHKAEVEKNKVGLLQ